jgi:hypothetical protein
MTDSSKTFTVPKNVTAIDRLRNVRGYEEVRFEAGTNIEVLGRCSFRKFRSVKSIVIPASVKVIQDKCFSIGPLQNSRLESVTFEAGSQLSTIESLSFVFCPLLKSITIPASVQFMDAVSFFGSGIRRVDVEASNPFYRNVGDFVIKLDESKIIFYCGSDAVILIPDFVRIVGDGSFHDRESIRRVMFASGTQISSIESCAFSSCRHLESIIFPSSLKSVGTSGFRHCPSLHSVTFESGSELGEIQEGVFGSCEVLESISVPASVTHLGESSFEGCVGLTMMTIPADSKLRCIDRKAFAGCSSLQSLVVPSSVEEILSECFIGCDSLSSLTVSPASHLVILGDLPPMLPAFTAIPDVGMTQMRMIQSLKSVSLMRTSLDRLIHDRKTNGHQQFEQNQE